MNTDSEGKPATVPERTIQAGELRARWHWTEPCVCSDPMLEALGNGVKGGKWFSLLDKDEAASSSTTAGPAPTLRNLGSIP